MSYNTAFHLRAQQIVKLFNREKSSSQKT